MTQPSSYTRNWQRLEGLLVFLGALGFYLMWGPNLSFWAAFALFFAPDLSFVAYGLSRRIGSACYNLLHLYGLGWVLAVTGFATNTPLVSAIGLLWTAHAGFDRMLGYGLKERGSFDQTHLGPIGKAKRDPDATAP